MPRQERERRFISEYVMRTFEPGTWALNVPLGPVPDELVQIHGPSAAAQLFRPSRRRVDAVAWSEAAYLLIEAKIRDPFEGLGRLIVYLEEARNTEDLPGYTGQPIVPRLVVPFVIERDRIAAHKHDIELAEFSPPWISDYVQERQRYFTREYREARDEKVRMRKLLNLD